MIPNITKGRGVSGALKYALGEGNDANGRRIVLEDGQTSRAKVLGGQNFGFEVNSQEKLDLARRMMEWNGKPENQASQGRKCDNDCLHASLSWEKGQTPNAKEMTEAAQSFLKSLGMETAQAVFVAHHDTDHPHLHIIASRLDPTSGKTYSQEDDFSKAQAWGLQWERQHNQISQNPQRQALHRIVDAIEARDGMVLVDRLTERTPTFTARELDKALSLGVMTKPERAAFRGEIMADKHVLGLRDASDTETTRYTTRTVLADEMQLVRNADGLAKNNSFGMSQTRTDAIGKEFTLKPEQDAALAHLTSSEGFGMLWGEAGTGKSHTLKATRAAYEAEGFKVIGLAWTNDVVQQMRGDGFKSNTITAELGALEDGKKSWDKKTVLVVDEAAMISTRDLGRLAGAALDAGAKLILAGDDAQLSSIERGGMFQTLRQQHDAAILNDVQRVKDPEQQAAFNTMHKGGFLKALHTFDAAGGIHWSEKQADALRDMAQKYTEDVTADPSKRRFMFAHTNAEVAALNGFARAIHQKNGNLGEDITVRTANGEAAFAPGDRVQFSGNGYGKRQKDAGLTNGRVGTIKDITLEGDFMVPRVTVLLDTAKDKPAQEVSFVVGDNGKAGEFNHFKHGYAGTIYRGQGRTLDETYVCHSEQWRQSAAYVALTRHREQVHIFASAETMARMDKTPDFWLAAANVTLEVDDYRKVRNAHNLNVMAKGLQRPENKRAATTYELDNRSALRIDYDDVAHTLTAAQSDRPESSRGIDRIQATLAADQHQRQQQPGKASGEPNDAVADFASGRFERLGTILKADQIDRQAAQQALQELAKLFGVEILSEDVAALPRGREMGGGRSL